MDPADDENMAAEKALRISKQMFIGGFFFLPWLWLCNYLYYREYFAPAKNKYPDKVRWYAHASLIGFLVEVPFFLVWFIVFVVKRNDWGATGDAISLVIPEGQ